MDDANKVTDPLKVKYDASVVTKTADAATTADAKKLYDDQKAVFDAAPTKDKNDEAGKVSTAYGKIASPMGTWKSLAATATSKYTAYKSATDDFTKKKDLKCATGTAVVKGAA